MVGIWLGKWGGMGGGGLGGSNTRLGKCPSEGFTGLDSNWNGPVSFMRSTTNRPPNQG